MIKTVGLLKKRTGMTTEEFRAYYETYHRLIGEKYLCGYASKYMRRFLNPQPGRPQPDEPEFDVILEIWYPDAETQAACADVLSQPDVLKEITEDEEKLFDRDHMRFFTVDEFESELTKGKKNE